MPGPKRRSLRRSAQPTRSEEQAKRNSLLALLVCICTSVSSARADGVDAMITSMAEVQNLEASEAKLKLSVCLRGTLLFLNDGFACVHDGQVGVFVKLEGETAAVVGDQVEVAGDTAFDGCGIGVKANRVDRIGEGSPAPVPAPLVGTLGEIGQHYGQWTAFDGVVYRTLSKDNHDCLYVAGTDIGVRAMIPKATALPPLDELEGRHITLTGMCRLRDRGDSKRSVDLYVPADGMVEIAPELDGRDTGTTLQLSELDRFGRDGSPEPLIQTQVQVALVAGRWLFVFDESGSTVVRSDQPVDVEAGDLVMVQGVVLSERPKAQLIRATVTKVGRGHELKVKPLPTAEARDHYGEVVEMQGTVVASEATQAGWHRLLMHDGVVAYQAMIPPAMAETIDESAIAPGTPLRMVGGVWRSAIGRYPFELVLQSYTPLAQVAAAGPLWPINLTIFSVTALVLTAVLIWLHRRQAAGQQQFYSHVHEQLDGMAHVARVNTLAEMVGALSHELSQPLASLTNFASAAQSLEDRCDDAPPQLGPIIGRIKDEAHRANELIRRLRLLTRKQTAGRELADIDALVVESVELFRFQGSARALVVDLDLHGSLPQVNVDLVQLEQVLLNLLNNARDATLALEDRRPSISIRTRLRDGGVEVIVEDNGAGIPETADDALFEPYYTTKSDGTGLGLAISRTIVESHGGRIVAEQNDPYGARLRLTLPVETADTTPRLAAG